MYMGVGKDRAGQPWVGLSGAGVSLSVDIRCLPNGAFTACRNLPVTEQRSAGIGHNSACRPVRAPFYSFSIFSGEACFSCVHMHVEAQG